MITKKITLAFIGITAMGAMLCPVSAEEGFGFLPASDVLKYNLPDGSWIAVRPSGTEPKIKVYYSIKGTSEEEAAEKAEEYRKTVKERFCL